MMLRMRWIAFACIVAIVSCERNRSAQTAMKGQNNTTMTFYGVAVDQDGKALEGAEFEIQVESIPEDWTFDTRGKPDIYTILSTRSDATGHFQIEMNAHIVRFKKIERPGYRHFNEIEMGPTDFDNTFYQINAWSDLWYKTDADHPAVYVFVKDGVHQTSALPCRGGFDSYGGRTWHLNKPGWPKQPSLKDVVYKSPSTLPAVEQ